MTQMPELSPQPPTALRLPHALRKLINPNNKGAANAILEAAAFALERMPEPSRPLTFADLESLMRDAITTFRGLEDAAKQVLALNKQVADLTGQLSAAQAAAKTAADAQAAAEKALADAQANAIPAADLADGNTLLDQLQTPAPAPAAVSNVNDPNKDQ